VEILSLLERARDAGLVLKVDGHELVIRGPRKAEAVARMILENKSAVLKALAPEQKPPSARNDLPVCPHPKDRPFVARLPDPARPRSDKAVMVHPGEAVPPGAWAWREDGGEIWYRLGPPNTYPGPDRDANLTEQPRRTCHPPADLKSVVQETVAEGLEEEPGEWDEETGELVTWFIETGQHRIPPEPFHLVHWLHVFGPDKFREAILSDINSGPDGPRNRYGALRADLKRLRTSFRAWRTKENGTR